ncbi:MAG TPA: hypothetical protein VMT35_06795 [Ignavibacteriaceae bacterium]|nr:hypothetical protein [Ignavibacteriaceae bacterium]
MKIYLFFPVSLMILLLFGCNKKSSITNSETENEKGAISLSIDKQNAPSNVVTVKALLSRENFESITGELNILTDSTADIFLEDIYVGKWHLLVEGLNENETVVYKGETDVTILEGITAQVNLVLSPTGQGTGSIYIYVTWGKEEWTDYLHNPIISKDDSEYDKFGVGVSFLLKDETNYKMWYTGLSYSGTSYVYYAFSENGLQWEKYGQSPVLFPDSSGWDSYHVSSGPVIKEDGTYKMYYSGWNDQYGSWPVGLAISPDGIHWTRYACNPIITGEGWDLQIRPQSIIKKDGIYYMFFTGGTGHECKIGVATSSNGIDWEKYSGNPVMVAEKSWEGYGVAFPSVIYENNEFAMVYQGILDENTSFGLASSTDGLHWTKNSSNPFFKTEDCNRDVYKISFPYYLISGNEQRIYYTGFDTYSSDWYICLSRKFN